MDNSVLKVLGVSIAYAFGALVAIGIIALMFYTPEFFK
jgi:hypothetical protein